MAHITADRVRDTSTTTGTGAFAVSGTAPTGYRTFSAVLATNDTCWYAIQHQTAAEWEVGLGTYSSANTITRTTVLASSNSGSAVSFSAGTKDVFITLAASKTVQQDNSGAVGIDANSSSAALRITQTGAGNAFVVEDSTNPDSTPFVVDANGVVVIGNTASQGQVPMGDGARYTPQTQMQGALYGTSGLSATLFNAAAATGGGSLALNKSNTNTLGGQAVVANGDILGTVFFNGSDGTNFVRGAQIQAAVDGTPGTNDMPGRLVFSTTADGASTPTERMRIDNLGNVGIGSTALTGYNLRIVKNLTGSTTSRSILTQPAIQSDVTANSISIQSLPTTAASAFTLGSMIHFLAEQGTLGAGSAVTNQYGYYSGQSMIGATANYAFIADNTAAVTTGKTAYGFYSTINTATGGGTTWQMYLAGTANSYIGGNVGIGTTTPGGALGVASAVVLGNQASTGTSGTIRMIASGGVAYIQVGQNTTTASAAPLVFGSLNGGSEWMRIDSSGNVGIGTSTFGTSAAKVLALGNATAPTTGPADTIQIYSTDLSAGNTMLSLYTEGTVVNANTTAATTHRIAIRVNGTVYYLLANTAA